MCFSPFFPIYHRLVLINRFGNDFENTAVSVRSQQKRVILLRDETKQNKAQTQAHKIVSKRHVFMQSVMISYSFVQWIRLLAPSVINRRREYISEKSLCVLMKATA